ncbi:(2Fe-2S)-binding protein [soil metagenome]
MVLTINGKQHNVQVEQDADLLSVLREDLDLTGSKYGCGEGACGSCTVLMDGKPTKSCITKASEVSGKEIITIEGLAKNGKLHPVQQAYLEADPFQCAYCAPGMVMSTVALLKQNSSPSEEDIISALNGNICRCGTYPKIVKAVKIAANS